MTAGLPLGAVAVRPLDASTMDDFRMLFSARFPDGNAEAVEFMLANPACGRGTPTGAVAYDETGSVVAIQGVAPRKACFGQRELAVGLAMAMAVAKDVDRSFFTPFLREAMEASGADMIFGNTAIPGSRRRLQAAIGVLDGPASCAEIRERELRSSGLAARVVRKVLARCGTAVMSCDLPAADEVVASGGGLVLTRECGMADRDLDDFWTRYLKDNRGLVSSRTSGELRWAFGRGLANGEVVFLTARGGGGLRGYAFCRRTDATAACWRIVDMIALQDDAQVLTALIDAAAAFLRRRTQATCLQVTGFPTRVQPLLRRLFPKSASFGFNKCIWAYLNEPARALCGDWVNAKDGWYGCPYDGDMFLL